MTNPKRGVLSQDILSELEFERPQVKPIQAGLNSSAYKIEERDKIVFLKTYNDSRDSRRREREVFFLKAAKDAGIKAIPSLIKSSAALNYCALSWIDGKRIEEANTEDWYSQIYFLRQIQSIFDHKLNDSILLAADAVFTLREHHNLATRRLYKSIESIMGGEIEPACPVIKSIRLETIKLQKEIESMIKPSSNLNRNNSVIISPSDIGFHNSLKTEKSCIFFDFEYAGIDDPYKLLSDWCIHPDWHPPLDLIPVFLKNIFQGYSNIIFDQHKAQAMLKIYQIKWASIILNAHRKDRESNSILKYKKKALSFLKDSNKRRNEIYKKFAEYSSKNN